MWESVEITVEVNRESKGEERKYATQRRGKMGLELKHLPDSVYLGAGPGNYLSGTQRIIRSYF